MMQPVQNIREDVVTQVVATGKWSADTVRLAERADWRCEYCGRDLLASAEAYKLWSDDHIVPKRCGGSDEFDNKAIACRPCNFNFKWRWDPRTIAGPTASRCELIHAAKRYIEDKKAQCENEVAHLRKVVGRSDPEKSIAVSAK